MRKSLVLAAFGVVCGICVVHGQMTPPGVVRSRPGTAAAPPSAPPQVESAATRASTDMDMRAASAADVSGEMTARLNFIEAPLDFMLADYSEKTGMTLLRAPGLPTPTFTLRSQGDLTIPEYLKAVETVLTMHGVGLVAYGERFMRVVPIAAVRREGGDVLEALPEGVVLEQTGLMVSQMVSLKHIDIQEATAAIEPMRNEKGQIHAFERINSLMITDYAGNINRMLQVLRMLDQPIEAREEPNIIQIRFAKASDIKQRLEEIIAESQKAQQQPSAPKQRTSGRPGVEPAAPAAGGPAGVIRPSSVRQRATETSEPDLVTDALLIADAQRGIIRGKVQIIADERTNLLIIITRPENMAFFKNIIAVLDVETSPDVMVEVVRLEYADAAEIAGMLNDLIGATTKDDRPTAPGASDGDGGVESRRLAEIEAALRRQEANLEAARKSSVGELSKDNVKILSDKRTNSLILMASKSDIATIRDIVRDMDRMLSQVLIEAVILNVELGDSLQTGVSWVQQALTTYTQNSRGQRSPILSFAGGGGGATGIKPTDATAIVDPSTLATSGLGYFFTLFDLNIHAVLEASAADRRTRVVSTPALLTTDNTEATLSSTDRIYVFEGTTFYDNSNNSSARYRQEDIGLTLKVKPQINENNVVMMEISQEFSRPGGSANTDTDNLSGQLISSNRKIEASIAVRSGQTIVLGGFVTDEDDRNRTKIPLLGDIPVVGRIFNSDAKSTRRTETVVFMTPYVLDTPEKVMQETQRRRDSLNMEGLWEQGWSGSELADPPGYERPLPRARTSSGTPRQQPLLQRGRDVPAVSVPSLVVPPVAAPVPTPALRSAPAVAVPPLEQGKMANSREEDDVTRYIEEQRRRMRDALNGSTVAP